MKRITVNYIYEVKEILTKSKEATVYRDVASGKYIVEYFPATKENWKGGSGLCVIQSATRKKIQSIAKKYVTLWDSR